MHWQIITGEYPPQIGGISDYTRLAALGLAAAGDKVDVWSGPCSEPDPGDPGVRVHRLPDHFGRRALPALDSAMRALPRTERRVLVQYEPWSFGRSGMNVPFCFWLWRLGTACDLTVMFHEVGTDLGWRLLPKHNLLGAITRLSAGLAVRGARRAFVSIPAWAALLRPLAGATKSIEWLPVPSNLPPAAPPAARTAEVRQELLRGRAELIGHFGTFRGHVATALEEILPVVLQRDARAVLVGRGAAAFCSRLPAEIASRVTAADSLTGEQVAEHLAACDVQVQPYPDGISARRSSSMAGLKLGCAVVSNGGDLSEDFWATCGALRLVPTPDPAAIAAAVCDLLDNPAERARLGAAASKFYIRNFTADRVVSALRAL